MPRKRNDNPAASFQATLRAALEHLNDPAWLAEHSPLAAAYFLSERSGSGSANDRGRALAGLLAEAMDRLWDGPLPPTATALVNAVEEARREQGNKGDEYAYLLLELRYFRRHFAPRDYPAQVTDIPVFLHVSTTRFFIHLDQAIDRLGEWVLRLAQPSLRPERPPAAPELVGRARDLAALRDALETTGRATLSGAAGVGKTTLAAAAVAARPPAQTFWYTFLPNFNDNLPALLFALGHFLRDVGRSSLWLQLVADRGHVPNLEQAMGMLRADLAALPFAPLLCFDEVDLLHASDGDARSSAHAQVLALLEALSGLCPVLFIGQRGYIDTPAHIALEPFGDGDVAALLAAGGLSLSAREVEQVCRATGGLPRLLELVIALVRDGDDLDEIVRLHLRADARPLFNRLWRRLDRPERELLIALSVFRSAIPAGAWPAHAAAMRSLCDRRLAQLTDAGEVLPLPFFRRLVYEELRPEQRETTHAGAARLRTARGEFTAAAYHYVQAGDPESAVAVWYPNRELEIERGQAGAALDVFTALSARRMSRRGGAQLKVIQNQLYALTGMFRQVVDNMAGFEWEIGDAHTVIAHHQSGDAHRTLGNHDIALADFERATEGMAAMIDISVKSFIGRGFIHLAEGDMTAALAEVRRARIQAGAFEGYLHMAAGHYQVAEAIYKEALLLAESDRDADPAVIQIHQYMGYLLGSRGDIAAAERHYGVAIEYYKRRNDLVRLEGARADLGGVYLNARQFDRFIPPAERALAFFEGIAYEQRVNQLTADLAEAYLETGRIDEAATYANRVLQMEVPRHRPYALYTLGLVHQRRGRPDLAAVAFADGIRTARANGDRFIEAYLHRLDGRLRVEQGDVATGRVALEEAIGLFAAMGVSYEADATRDELARIDGATVKAEQSVDALD